MRARGALAQQPRHRARLLKENCRRADMVGPGPCAAAAAAAAEERRRKLQEYLTAKGRLKTQNTKPYLKAKNCPNPPPSKSTIKPKRNVTSHAVLPVEATRPTSARPQPRPASTRVSQKPKSEPPPPVGRRPAAGRASASPHGEASSSSGQRPAAAGPSAGPGRAPSALGLTTAPRRAPGPGRPACSDSVGRTQVGENAAEGFLRETNKENLSRTPPEAAGTPGAELCATGKLNANSRSQATGSVAPKRPPGRRSASEAVLGDRANRQLAGTAPPRKAAFPRAGGALPRTAPSRCHQTLRRTPASAKPVPKDAQGNGGPRAQPQPGAEQKAKHTKPWAQPGPPRGEHGQRHPQATQPRLRPQTSCALQKPKATSQRPKVTVGSLDPGAARTPGVGARRSTVSRCGNGFQHKEPMLDSTLKRAFPPRHLLSKTAPKTQAAGRDVSGRGVPRGAQTNPEVKKKAAVDDRRRQLEEWQKSKGKMYKRPPIELKTKRKAIEKMNISFWKSIEREEEEKKAQWEVCSKINGTLAKCLRLIEEGVLSNEISTILSSIPEAEKFAKFWICKAKLLASKGTFDVIGLYEEAIKSGATPIQELREVVLNMLQDTNRSTEGIACDSSAAEPSVPPVGGLAEEPGSAQACPPPGEPRPAASAGQASHPGIKLQVAPVPRPSGMPEVQGTKLITPVRRSARIERASARYPDTLREHDVVVASLGELLQVEDTERFIFRENEALPVKLGFEALEL